MGYSRKEYKSNLINDEELAKKFSEEAFLVARSLRTKYFSLFEFMTEDDIVMECWDKILRQDIGFDDTKNCKFSSFVRMMVNNRCIDLCRKIQKHEGILSLDSTYSSDDGDTSTLMDYVPDRDSYDVCEDVGVRDVILSLGRDMNGIPTEKILMMYQDGYNAIDISESLGVPLSDVRAVRSKMKNIFKRRCQGTGQPLADILYGDESVLEERKDELMGTLCYVREGGIKLSDVVKLVISGYSYKGIGEKLGATEGFVKYFLDKCSSMIV